MEQRFDKFFFKEIETEKNANEHALQELQARLDAAIVVKEQTEKVINRITFTYLLLV